MSRSYVRAPTVEVTGNLISPTERTVRRYRVVAALGPIDPVYVAICMGVLVKAGRNAGSVSVAVRSASAARASGHRPGAKTGVETRAWREYEPLETHTQPTYSSAARRPQSLRTKRARPGRDAAAGPPPRLFAPYARPRRQCLRLRGGSLRPHHAAGGGLRRAFGGRQPAAHTQPRSALSVDAPFGAPPERERKISHSTPPSRDERRHRVTS